MDLQPQPLKVCSGSLRILGRRPRSPVPRRETGAATAAPARMLVKRLKVFLSAQWRGDLKEGVSPSFIVSIRGVKRGKKSKSSPSCVFLFSSPFLLDKQEKRGSLPRPLHGRRILFPFFSWTGKRKAALNQRLKLLPSVHTPPPARRRRSSSARSSPSGRSRRRAHSPSRRSRRSGPGSARGAWPAR